MANKMLPGRIGAMSNAPQAVRRHLDARIAVHCGRLTRCPVGKAVVCVSCRWEAPTVLFPAPRPANQPAANPCEAAKLRCDLVVIGLRADLGEMTTVDERAQIVGEEPRPHILDSGINHAEAVKRRERWGRRGRR